MTVTAYERVGMALERVTGYRAREGADWRCPAHDDHNASLSVTPKDGKVLICCHRGCTAAEVLAALDLTASDLFDDRSVAQERQRITASYQYTDETGQLLFKVHRYTPKTFRQQAATGEWKLNGTRRVLYRLPEVIQAAAIGDRIYVTEGEKDADAIVRAGGVATCNPMGAGKWQPEFADSLAGAGQVVIVADRDTPGYKHARQVARSLHDIGEVITVHALEGKDAADHLAAGHPLDQLQRIDPADLDRLCEDPTEAEPAETEARDELGDLRQRLKAGGKFVLDDPADLQAIWGAGETVLWAAGEPLLVVGPTGVGKTTLAVQLVAGRLGLLDDLLGYPITDDHRPILYLALDRPRQIRRAMLRLLGEHHREVLDRRLVVWEGPLPLDLGKQPGILLDVVQAANAGTVIIDSLKDAAVKLTDDEAGGNLNRAIQHVIADGREVISLHHQRKGQNGTKPSTLEDVYGSTWITAGTGSVLLIWGSAGDPIVELRHLKQPAGEVGPLKIEHDHHAGTSSVYRGQVDALLMLRNAGSQGLTATQLAAAMFEKTNPTDNERKKAQRTLDRLVRDGHAHRTGSTKGGEGGTSSARYYPIDNVHQEP